MEQTLKHRVGDIVKIKSREWYNENKDKDGVVRLKEQLFERSMSEYLGKTAKIMEIKTSKIYGLDIDEQWWNWTDEMFEDEDIFNEDKNSETKKEIDWEQRRWELFKIFLSDFDSFDSMEVYFLTEEVVAKYAYSKADRFIKLFKNI